MINDALLCHLRCQLVACKAGGRLKSVRLH